MPIASALNGHVVCILVHLHVTFRTHLHTVQRRTSCVRDSNSSSEIWSAVYSAEDCVRQTDILQPPPHFHHAHQTVCLDTNNLSRRCAKVLPVDRHGGTSAAWIFSDYLVSDLLAIFARSCYRWKSGRARRHRSSIRPMMESGPRLGSPEDFRLRNV